MNVKQYYLGCLSHASYLITDDRTKTAAVVDPQRDIEQYLADAAAGGYQIKHVFLTHFHADFLAGHIELRNRAGAKNLPRQPRRSRIRFREGEGRRPHRVRGRASGDPGNSRPYARGHLDPGLRLAQERGQPYAVLTGDTLFIGDVGRPDLLASIGVTADELADMLYDSITNKLVKLPDETLVYPAHGAGSMCGKSLSKETVSTIGEQKKFNYALQPMSREEFKRIVIAEQPEAPAYFVHDAILNRQERPTLEQHAGEVASGTNAG